MEQLPSARVSLNRISHRLRLCSKRRANRSSRHSIMLVQGQASSSLSMQPCPSLHTVAVGSCSQCLLATRSTSRMPWPVPSKSRLKRPPSSPPAKHPLTLSRMSHCSLIGTEWTPVLRRRQEFKSHAYFKKHRWGLGPRQLVSSRRCRSASSY